MTEKKRPPESEGKDADDGAASLDALVPTPMQRFRSLARRLTNVSKQDLEKEQRHYASQKRKRQNEKG